MFNAMKDSGLNKYDGWGVALSLIGTGLAIAVQIGGIILGTKAYNQRMIDQQNRLIPPQQ